jgi:hypothetical protein
VRFTGEDGLLCVFDRETKAFRKQRPVNTALEKDFYTITDKHGVRSDAIEQRGFRGWMEKQAGLPADWMPGTLAGKRNKSAFLLPFSLGTSTPGRLCSTRSKLHLQSVCIACG